MGNRTRKCGLDSFKEMRVATSEQMESLSASKSENSLPASEALYEKKMKMVKGKRLDGSKEQN